MAAGYGAIASGGAATTRRSPALPIVALALCAMAVVAATVSLAQVLCPVLFAPSLQEHVGAGAVQSMPARWSRHRRRGQLLFSCGSCCVCIRISDSGTDAAAPAASLECCLFAVISPL